MQLPVSFRPVALNCTAGAIFEQEAISAGGHGCARPAVRANALGSDLLATTAAIASASQLKAVVGGGVGGPVGDQVPASSSGSMVATVTVPVMVVCGVQ